MSEQIDLTQDVLANLDFKPDIECEMTHQGQAICNMPAEWWQSATIPCGCAASLPICGSHKNYHERSYAEGVAGCLQHQASATSLRFTPIN